MLQNNKELVLAMKINLNNKILVKSTQLLKFIFIRITNNLNSNSSISISNLKSKLIKILHHQNKNNIRYNNINCQLIVNNKHYNVNHYNNFKN